MKTTKMKSLLWLMMFAVAFSFAACGGSDDGDDDGGSAGGSTSSTSKTIVGTWSVSHKTGTIYNNGLIQDSWDFDVDVKSEDYEEVALHEDGTVDLYEWNSTLTSFAKWGTSTYTFKDNVLTINYGPNDYDKYDVTWKGNDTVVLSNANYMQASGSWTEWNEDTYVRGSRR